MRTAFVIPIVLALAACGPTLPKLPDLDFSPFPPAVRQAIEQAQSEAEFTPGDNIRVMTLAKVLHAHGLLDAATVYYRYARKLSPDDATCLHLLGMALSERGNYPDALEALNAALARRPDHKATKFALAAALLASGGTVEASALYRALGDHPVAHFGLGQTLRGAAQIEEFRKALALEPRYGASWKAIAEALRVKGENEKADEASRGYDRYHDFTPSTGDAELAAVGELDQRPAGLRQRAQRAESESRLLDAAKLYEQAVNHDPNDDAVIAKWIATLVRLKDQDAATKAYQAGILRKPESPSLAAVYGLLLNATHRRAEAGLYFEKAVAADPRQAEAWFELGLNAAAEGADQRALDCFGKALLADPAHRQARYQAALVLTKNRKGDLAREQLELAAQGPDDEWTGKARLALAGLPKR